MMIRVAMAVVVAAAFAGAASAAETPKRGGTLTFAVGGEPPNYDCHANTSFAAIHPLAPHYSLLLKFDQAKYPNIVGDLAQSWDVSKDQLTFTFKLKPNVKFHDGSPLTSADVKASYERIRKPPQGVVSSRQAAFEDVSEIQAPDPQTVVFKLAKPSASMLADLASPWNCIYSAAKLQADPKWPERNVMGSGPFKFVEHVKGSHWVGQRFDDYFEQGKPYLDGFRAVFLTGAAMINALQGGQITAEFRGLAPADRDRLVQTLGDKIKVEEGPWTCKLDVIFNIEKKPFDDVKVRRALSLAIDRWTGSQALRKIALVRDPGALFRPGYEYAVGEGDLAKLPGFGRDGKSAKEQAKKLLKEAGQEKLTFRLLNRSIPMPYTPVALFVIDQWRQIGINVEHEQLETAPYQAGLASGNYQAALTFTCDYMDEPNIQLLNYLSADVTSLNYGRYKDRTLDQLFEKQKRLTDKGERLKTVHEFERRVLDQAYVAPIIWWWRIIAYYKEMKGWQNLPSHYVNQDLTAVWLDR
jgi:peptide/nickel transport system substrate-binding protein